MEALNVLLEVIDSTNTIASPLSKRSYEIIDNHKHVLPHAPNHPPNNINRTANARI